MRQNPLLLALLSVLVLISFASQNSCFAKMNPEAYANWYRANISQFEKVAIQNGIQYTLTYVPLEIQLINYSNKKKMTKLEVGEFVKTFEESYDFRLTITSLENDNSEFLKTIGSNGITYEERVKYYSFGLQQDIKMIFEDHENVSIDYLFERSFDINPKGHIQFSFAKEELPKNIKIAINDLGFYENLIEFNFLKIAFENRPKLKYSKIWKRK